jgi:peptide/nickel transport system permease protein
MAAHVSLSPDAVLDGLVDGAGSSRGGSRLARLIAARLASAAFVLWAAVTVTFAAIHLTPGDTVGLLLGENRNDPDLRAAIIDRWGLDQPLWSQYLLYLTRIPTGAFGTSYTLRRPVGELIVEGMGPTFQLTFLAVGLGVVLGFVLAYATTTKAPGVRPIANFVELVFLSVPPFWLGILLLAVFSFQLGWFSVVDYGSLQGLVLPVLAIGLPEAFFLAQIIRDGIDRGLEAPFALSARLRGISTGAVRRRHALRHASLPAITMIGLAVGGLLGGAVIVETVFGRPGLGQLAVNAVTVKDVPLILGVTLVSTAVFVVASTAVDLLGLALDPRIRATAKV